MLHRVGLRALLLVLASSSCASLPPKHEVHTAAGTVRSFDPESARRISALAEELAPQVCEHLGIAPGAPYEIWHLRRPPGSIDGGLFMERDRHGMTTDMRIVISEKAYRTLPRFLVAHELVHWYMRGTAWDRAPLVVEEGIADAVAMALDPEATASRKRKLVARILRVEPETRARTMLARRGAWSRQGKGERSSIYFVGYDIVARLGIDALRAMAERACAEGFEEVPQEWIEEALASSQCTSCGELPQWVWTGVLVPTLLQDGSETRMTMEGLLPEGSTVAIELEPELKCACPRAAVSE